MLKINNLKVSVDGKEILGGVNVDLNKGEVVVIFGPNGCGKSTLLNTIMGLKKYQITEGNISFNDEKINDWPIDKRAKEGVSLMFQRPPKIDGVNLGRIVETIGENGKEMVAKLKVGKFMDREVNKDLSGGELKRSELLQILVQDKELVLLDEPDSGVDVDNIKLIATEINNLVKKGKGVLVITHSGHLLKYIKADRSYVMMGGKVYCEGDPKEMFEAISRYGYKECINCQKRKNG